VPVELFRVLYSVRGGSLRSGGGNSLMHSLD